MPDHQILAMLRQVLENQQRILRKQERMMATLNDISTALNNLSGNITTGFQTLTTDLTTLLNDLGAQPGQIQTIVDSVNSLGTSFQNDVTTLDSAIKAADPGNAPTKA